MIFRDWVSYALLCAGSASVAVAGGRYAQGEWQRHEARSAWELAEARAVVALAHRSAALEKGGSKYVEAGVPVARLQIPRLRMDEIVLEGVDDNSLNAGPGHLPGSAYPGERGNAVISAHRDRHFSRLDELRVGDTLFTDSGARTERWVVTSRRVVGAEAPAIFRTSDATLTLTTCWPIRYLGTAPDRLIVTAKPIELSSLARAPNAS